MESQEGSGNVPRWENMDKDILSNIFKKLDVVDVIMGASRVCITWFLASHNKTLWNTIKLNDLDSIFLDNPHVPDMQDNDKEKHRYHLRKILIEINKFGRTVPTNFFFNLYCNILKEDLAIISEGLPNIRKLALPTWKCLKLNSYHSAFSIWKNLHTLIIAQYFKLGDALNFEFKVIAEHCRNLTSIKCTFLLDKELAKRIVFDLPNLERLSFRCAFVCREAVMSLIIGLPNLKILNLSHCIFTERRYNDRTNVISGMKPKEELVKIGTQKLENFRVCCSNCTICQDVWKYRLGQSHPSEFRNFWDKQWKTDEIKEFEF